MAMTDEEKWVFDLTGFLVRPAILEPDEIQTIVDQIHRAHHDPESLPPEHRAAPGGPAQILVDHPKVVDVLRERIPSHVEGEEGTAVRCDTAFFVYREQGVGFVGGDLHRGATSPVDPVFGYGVHNGRFHAGEVNVVFELTDVEEHDGATGFVVGSHKANFPIPESHRSTVAGEESPFYRSYSCPAGSAIFFNEHLLHAGPVWRRPEPRYAVIHTYLHAGVRYHREHFPRELIESLPPERRAWFRDPWLTDMTGERPVFNTVEEYLRG